MWQALDLHSQLETLFQTFEAYVQDMEHALAQLAARATDDQTAIQAQVSTAMRTCHQCPVLPDDHSNFSHVLMQHIFKAACCRLDASPWQ